MPDEQKKRAVGYLILLTLTTLVMGLTAGFMLGRQQGDQYRAIVNEIKKHDVFITACLELGIENGVADDPKLIDFCQDQASKAAREAQKSAS